MKGKYWLTALLLVILLLALRPERGILAQENEPEIMGVEEERSTTITPVMGYQGRLVEGGEPVTGTRTMTFRFFDAEEEGLYFWEETKDVNVVNGLFQTALGDTNPFQSHDKLFLSETVWLEVEVGGTILPRQLLMGAPYALSLAPGATVSGNENQLVLLGGETLQGPVAVVGRVESGVGVVGVSSSGVGVEAVGGGIGKDNAALVTRSTISPGGIALYAISIGEETTAVFHNYGVGPLLAGYQGGDFNNTKFLVDNDGDVEQDLDAGGLVKAAVSVDCKSAPTIDRYFQGMGSTHDITVKAATDGCIIDFGMNVSDRFWSATAAQARGFFAGCYHSGICSETELFCYLYDYSGDPRDGHIMVILY